MNVETGDYVEATSFQEGVDKLREIDPATREQDVVMVEAYEDQMRRLQEKIRQSEYGRRP